MPVISLLVLSLVGTTSCFLLGFALASHFRKKNLENAPVIQNPARTKRLAGSLPSANGKTILRLYSPESGFCLDTQLRVSSIDVRATRYELRALETVDQKVSTALRVAPTSVRILRSDSKIETYNTVVRDRIKDRSGRVIATQERNVQRVRTVYDTLARVCFPTGTVPHVKSKYLEFVGVGRGRAWAAWRLQ